MLAVIDTNILVSALWTDKGNPARIVELALNRRITPCYDCRILKEYEAVLSRPRFNFAKWKIEYLLEQIEHEGMSVIAQPIDISFADESDKKFYEAAKQCGAALITGNLKHFPAEKWIMSPADFLAGM